MFYANSSHSEDLRDYSTCNCFPVFKQFINSAFVRICCLLFTVSLGCSNSLELSAEEKSQQKETNVSDKAEEKLPEYPRPRKFPLPENLLDVTNAEWLNTSGEISMKDLKGKIVLFDFWTYCCINCIHVLPDLEYLEQKYPNELVVVGVHSAKFDNEKVSDNIRDAIVRYEIEHPVLNDANMIIWRKLGIRSWPSLVLIDAEGNACLLASGEGNRDLMDDYISKLIAYHDARGQLDRSPINFALEREKLPATPLKYPGKLLVDEPNNRIFISDSNHNRIVVSSLDGNLIDVIGTGVLGKADGSYSEATFDHPQGMTLLGDVLYVADTENHLIRTVDLKKKQVSTLIGTGEQSRFRSSGGNIKTAAINSPWALAIHDEILYIAMAGPHQLWQHKLGSNEVSVYAGSGREDITDGALLKGALAQPSSLVLHNNNLYVADSEGSSIREVPTDPEGEMRTIVGTHDLPSGRCLFEFGDIDGKGPEARLQHPLGLIFKDDTLFIADSYNHKVKQVRIEKEDGQNIGFSETLLGNGKAGNSLDPLQLSEPAGLAVVGDSLLIADTNNHRIVNYNLKTKTATEFVVAGLKPPKPVENKAISSADVGQTQTLDKVTAIATGSSLKLIIEVEMEEGYKLNKLYPASGLLETAKPAHFGDGVLGKRQKLEFLSENQLQLTLPLSETAGETELTFTARFGYCRDGKGGLCKLSSGKWILPLKLTAGEGESSIKLKLKAQ